MSDERITDLILQRLENIERKIDIIQAHGCSKAEGHLRMQANEADLFSRMNALEKAQAEGRGKLAMVVAILSSGSGLFFAWVGKHIT